MHRDSIHLVPLMAGIESLNVVISAAICAAFSASYTVLTFHVPNSVVNLGERSKVGLVSPFRLLPGCVIGVSEETFS